MGYYSVVKWSTMSDLRYTIIFVVAMVMLLSYHTIILLSKSQEDLALRQETQLAATKDVSYNTPQEHPGATSKSHTHSASVIEQQNGSQTKTPHKPSLHHSIKEYTEDEKLQIFQSVLTRKEKTILLDIAKKLDHVTQLWNITYFLYGGALLGSYRHHDIIPWDDDLDVFVSLKQRYALFRAISTSTNFEVFLAGPRMKMWSSQSKKYTRYPWGWPYVDISFFEENATHIWDSAEEYKDFVYPKSVVFPRHRRPLAGYFFQAPKDSFANLKLTYKTTGCSSHHYSHKYEKIQKSNRRVSVPCEKFAETVPFVHRSRNNNGIRETLKLGYTVLQTLVVGEPSYAITEPYRLVLTDTSIND